MNQSWNDLAEHSIVELELDEGGSCRGVLVEITTTSATVDFPLAASSLLIGEAYWLSFRSNRIASSQIRILARIEFRGEDEHRCRYRFLITVEDSIGVKTLIEHREALRVGPPDGFVVPVQIWVDGGRETTACLDSLSRTGISVLFAEDPDPFIGAERVHMRLRLPDQAETLELTGFVCDRAVIDGQRHYGMEFELGRAVEFARKQRLIENYISTRLVEILRGVRGPAHLR